MYVKLAIVDLRQFADLSLSRPLSSRPPDPWEIRAAASFLIGSVGKLSV